MFTQGENHSGWVWVRKNKKREALEPGASSPHSREDNMMHSPQAYLGHDFVMSHLNLMYLYARKETDGGVWRTLLTECGEGPRCKECVPATAGCSPPSLRAPRQPRRARRLSSSCAGCVPPSASFKLTRPETQLSTQLANLT